MTTLTYTVNIPAERAVATDTAIGIFLMLHPDASVDDALDAIFRLGVQSVLEMDEEGTTA